MNLRRLMKALHELGSVGVLGGLAACIVLVWTAPTGSAAGFAAANHGVAMIVKWLLVPSLAVVLLSGLLAIVMTEAYIDAGWAWLKAFLGISMFEGTLLTVGGSARRAAELSALAVDGRGNATELAAVLRTEWGGLWVLTVVSVVSLVLGVWRPRFHRSRLSAG